MQDVNVVVVFCTHAAERLALAAAVGAVQARANIRLRLLQETDRTAADVPGTQDYVAPREADALWMDAMLLLSPAEAVKTYLDSPALNGKLVFTLEKHADSVEAATLLGREVAEAARAKRYGAGV